MIFIEEMKNLKIYRKPFFLPYEDKDKKHGSIVYLLTPNYVSSTEEMKLPYAINRHYFESYYFEKDITRFLGKAAAIKEAAEGNDTNSMHNDFDFDCFTAYAVKGEGVESVDFSETLEDAITALQCKNGTYSVYTHTIDNDTPVYIGKIMIQVIEFTDYRAIYKWTEFVDFETLEDEVAANEDCHVVKSYYSRPIEKRWNVVSKDGANNACVMVGGYDKPMRGRSTMLIMMNDNVVYAKVNDKEAEFPGGGWEPDEDPQDAAVREAIEEAHLIVKDVKHCGCCIEYYPDEVRDWVKENVNEKDWWYGYYSEVFVGTLEGDYTGHVKDQDEDPNIASGEFYALEEIRDKMPKEYLDAIKEYYGGDLQEGYFSDEDDIYYNKKAFDNGEINLCFITGLSGSGKTTMADGITKESIQLDDVNMNWHFTDKELKQYGDLISSYFEGPGKKFRIQPDQKPADVITEYQGNDYAEDNTKAFVAYAKQYARSHKKEKIIIEGVQLYCFIAPDDLVNYAVYIKGTGTTKSLFRSLIRDVKLSNKLPEKFIWAAKKLKDAPEYYTIYEKKVQKYRDYYRNKVVNLSEAFLGDQTVFSDFVVDNAMALYELEEALLEISKADESKNEKLEPVFVVTTFTNTPMGNTIKAVTGADYSHALLSLDSSLKDMYSFDFFKTVQNSDGVSRKYNGFIIDNIDRYKNMKISNMKVYCLMCTSKVKSSIDKALSWYKANIKNTRYSFSNLIDYFTKSKRITTNHDLSMMCSEFVDVILKTSGVDMSGKASNVTSPGDFGTYKNKSNFFKVFEGKATDYNSQDTDDQIDFMRHNVPYAQLNVKKRKADIINEADDSASDTDGLDLATRLKYKVRSIKMGGRKGLYKLNRQIRSIQNALPTVEDIQNSVSVGPGAVQGNQESASILRMLEAMEDSSLYYMIENEFIIFNEASPASEMQLRKLLYGDRIRNQKQVFEIYKKVKAELPFIRYTFPVIGRYDNRNVFYDLSYYNEVFFRNNTNTPIKTLNLYKEFLNRMLNKKNIPVTYTKKTVFIPVLAWDSNPKTRTWLFREGVNPLSMIYQMMQHDMNGLRNIFGNMDVVFTSPQFYFKINFSTLSKEEEKTCMSTFKRFIQKIKKGEQFDQNEVDEHPDEESPKVIATNILDKIEKAQGIDMSKHYASIAPYAATRAVTGIAVPAGIKIHSTSPLSSSERKKAIADDKKLQKVEDTQRNEVKKVTQVDVAKTTTSNDIAPEAKKAKAADKEAIELQKDKLTRRVVDVATKAKNTDNAIDMMEDDDDEIIKKMIMDLAVEEDPTVKINKARAARMMQLNDAIKEKDVNGVKIKDLLNEDKKDAVNAPLPTTTVRVDSPFQDQWEGLKYMNFDKTYDINKDIMKMLMALANKQYPISMRDIKVEDASTAEDYIDKYHIEFEDFRGKRFTVNLDVPKFKDNKYLILRGNKKTIQNQYFNMPILKTEQDTVQVISNYNKIFIRRFGNTAGKSITFVDRIIKAARKYTGRTIKFVPGDNSKLSNQFDMPIDYIDLGSIYNTIEVKGSKDVPDIIYYFNQVALREKYSDKIDDTKGFPYAVKVNTGEIVYFNRDFPEDTLSKRIVYTLCDASPDFKTIFEESRAAKKYVYSQASIMTTRIPLIIMCAYSEGLTPVLKKAGIRYELTEKLSSSDRHDIIKDWIKFADGYLVYEVDYESSLFLNGLKESDTEAYSINDINTKRIYTEMLDNYGGRLKADGIENFYECMLDPITLEVLEHYKLPTDYIELMIYANHLLADNKYISHGDSSSRRIRRNELIAVKVYKALFNDAYARYSYSIRNNIAGAAFTVKESAVIDKFMTDTISSDLSVINCLNDIETANAVTTKGESGMNSARAYTLDKRTYDASMLNLLGLSTGFAGNVGITRQATINMNIDTERGYIKSIEGDTSQMNVANTMTITEAMNPMGSTRDDPFRTAMTFIQTAKHQVRTTKSDPLLVTNGADEVLPYLTTDIFCKKADMAGKVIEKNQDYMIVEYENGKHDYIDLSEKIEKNSDGGFFVNTQLVTGMTEGKKFKAGEILAYEKDSFSKGYLGESDKLTYNVGKLAKVAIINSDDNFEDSAMVTSRLAEDLSTYVIVQEARVLSKDTNIYNVASVGQSVQQEDILFETQTAYEEEDINALLKSLAGDEETISRLNRRPVRSPVTGVIAGMKLYRTCEIEEMSPSLQKLFKSYEANAKKIQKHLKDLGIDDPTLTPSTKKLPPIGKLKNSPDSVLIEFYVRYHDIMAVGDKLTYWSANKGVVHAIVDSNEAPYTDFRPDEEISAFTGIASINKRQIASNIIIGSLNKLCIELGRKCREMLGMPFFDNEINL